MSQRAAKTIKRRFRLLNIDGARSLAYLVRSLVIAGALLAPANGADARQPFTLATYAKLQHLDALQISPDGALLALAVKQLRPERDDAVRSLWILAADGGRKEKVDDRLRPDGSPMQWAPTGQRLAYIGGTIAEPKLVTFDVATRQRRVLLAAEISSFAWDSTGQSIAVICHTAQSVSPDVTTSAEEISHNAIAIVNTTTAKVTRLVDDLSDDASALAWAPNGSSLVYTTGGDVYLMRIATHKIAPLVKRPGRDQYPVWSPDGQQIAFSSQYGRTGEQLSISIADAQTTHAAEDRFAGFDPGFGGFIVRYLSWSPDSRSLYVSGLSHMRQKLYRLDVETDAAESITTGDAVYHDFSITRDGKTLACLASKPDVPTYIVVSPIAPFVPRKLRWEYPELANIATSEVRVLRWQSADGLELEGLVMLPPDLQPKRRYPVVVLMEGSHGTFDLSYSTRVSADGPGATFPFEPRVFAGKGYVVFMPNVRGSWGLGERVRKAIVGDIARGPYGDLMSGLDALLAVDYVDSERIAIIGNGFDGYRGAYALTRTQRFKAAVLAEPFGVDLISFYSQPIFGSWVETNLGGAPWEQTAKYIELSPLLHANDVKTPTMLLCMNSERQLAADQCREFHHALTTVKTPTEMLLYRVDPWQFGVVKTRSFLDVMDRIVAWVERWSVPTK